MSNLCKKTKKVDQTGVRVFALALFLAPTLSLALAEILSAQTAQTAKSAKHNTNYQTKQSFEADQHVFDSLNKVDRLMKELKLVDARLALLELVKYDPNSYSAEVHVLLAEVDYRLGNSPEAIKHYQNAIKYDAGDARLYWNVALAFMNMSDYQNALIWSSRVLEHHPNQTLKLQVERFAADMQEKLAEQKRLANFSTTGDINKCDNNNNNNNNNNGNSSEDKAGSQYHTEKTAKKDDYLTELIAEKDVHHWAPGKMPLRVYLADCATKSLYHVQFRTYVLDSLNAWSKASGGKLSFLLTESSDCDLSITFTDKIADVSLKPGETPVEQGLTRFLLDGKDNLGSQIIKANVTILMLKPSSGKALSDDEMKEVCLHELGHSLGITGHSQNSADIMYFNQSFRQLPALTRRDKATMAELYQDYPALTQSGVLGYSYQPIERHN